ncbi:RNase adapter RapZ [Spirosoma sp. KUDC1026]|uniref:RNase adapter RapZ n=1 Tax=Spirosoma sp. KUDC1026 TaxID=2745947 RepID=UPI00159BD119|nr:AAA family ATPase [Spirosoma sp. KUDC1026]QKZ15386.1 AAA family ATPase [Spirosoma sp. KUDC1026]
MARFIISGGPGAGKSTLLNALRTAGFLCVDEVSRQLIQEQVMLSSSCLPWIDLDCFAKLALQRMIDQYEKASTDDDTSITFFDRGIPDIIAYLRVGGLPVEEAWYRAAGQFPYDPLVFMAPPWETIYVNDSERWQTFEEASALHQALVETYQALGYKIQELPQTSVADRVTFVRNAVGLLPRFAS